MNTWQVYSDPLPSQVVEVEVVTAAELNDATVVSHHPFYGALERTRRLDEASAPLAEPEIYDGLREDTRNLRGRGFT